MGLRTATLASGIVFDIKRFSIHDGPGIRTTVFLKGCPLSCWWCHNPEGQARQLELILRPERCIGCAACIEVCQEDAIVLKRGSIVTSPVCPTAPSWRTYGDSRATVTASSCAFPSSPKINDGPDKVRAVGTFARGLPSLERVDLLSYHRVGRHKYAQLGQACPMPDVNPPSDERSPRSPDGRGGSA